MTVVSFVCFITASGILLSCVYRGADVFSPARVFGLVWTVSIGLTDLKLSRLQHEWTPFAWLCLLVAVASFVLGILLVRILLLTRTEHSIGQVREKMLLLRVDSNYFFGLILALVAAYLFAYLIEWMSYGTLPIFAPYPEKARTEFGLFGIHLLSSSHAVLLFLVMQFFIIVKTHKYQKAILAVLFLLVLFMSALLLNRLLYTFFMVLALSFAYYSTRLVKPRTVFVSLVGLIFLLGYVQYFREVRFAENYLYVVSGMKYSKDYAIFTGPYMYIVMNLENFARAVERLGSYTLGYFTFDPLLAMGGLKHPLATYFGIVERPFLNSGYNTFPFFWTYYYDFGLLGIAFLPMLVGASVTQIHAWMKNTPTLFSVCLYGIVLYFMVMSFFTNLFSLLTFVFNAVLLLGSQYLLMRRTRYLS